MRASLRCLNQKVVLQCGHGTDAVENNLLPRMIPDGWRRINGTRNSIRMSLNQIFVKPFRFSGVFSLRETRWRAQMSGQELELERRGEVVRAVIRSRIRDPHVGEDLSQEVLLKCLRCFREKGEIQPEGYFVQAALNACRTWARNQKVRSRSGILEDEHEDKKENDPATLLAKRERSRALFSAFDALPSPVSRGRPRLSLIDGWTASKIADKQGCPVSTIKTRIRRAKEMLQHRLKPQVLD